MSTLQILKIMGKTYPRTRMANWALSISTIIFSGILWSKGNITLTMALVSASVSIVSPIIPICLKQYSLVITLGDFFMFALWLTTTGFLVFRIVTCIAVGPHDLCRKYEWTVAFSAVHTILHLLVLVRRVVEVHIPSWKQASGRSSGGVQDEQAVKEDLELGTVVVVPEAGVDSELATFVLTPETAEAVEIVTIVVGPEEYDPEHKEKSV